MKKRVMVAGAILGLCALCVAGLLATPLPTLWLLRRGFGEEAVVQLPHEERTRAAVEVTRDVTYPSKWGRNTYDVYLPRDAEGQLPVVVWMHGGAFVAGDKAGVEPWALSLAELGYAVVTPNYAWSGEVGYPAQGVQVQECIAELTRAAQVGELPIDMGRVVLAGDSAGAFLAAQAGLVATNAGYAREVGIESALAPDALRATLLFCGPYDINTILAGVEQLDEPLLGYMVDKLGWAFFGTPRWHDLPGVETTSIAQWVTGEYPPSFISDGNGFSFEKEGMMLADTLAARDVPVESLFFPHVEGEEPVDHEYQMDLVSEEGALAWERASAFLAEHCPVG